MPKSVVAVTPVRRGGGKKGEVKTFAVGDTVSGLSDEEEQALLDGGSVIESSGSTKIVSSTDDPTVKRDTLMMAAGKYNGAQPAAISGGMQVVNVVENTDSGSTTRTTLKAEGKAEDAGAGGGR